MDVKKTFDKIDRSITEWMAVFGIVLLRFSLGIVFFWFGVLKFFPGLSPADELARRTISIITFNMIPSDIAIKILASWECLIGVGLITGVFMRFTILLLVLQMAGTFMPLFLFPHETFARFPYAPTLEGQYIIKNLVLVSAALVIGATVRGGKIKPEPDSETGK